MRKIVVIIFSAIIYTFQLFSSISFAQETGQKDIPQTQKPIEERNSGDTFIENLGELPGDIITLPFKILFKGVGKVTEVVDYNATVLRVTDWLTSEDEKRKLRPSFMPRSGGGFSFRQDDLLKPGMKFRASASLGIRTRRNLYAGLRDLSFLAPHLGFEVGGFHSRLPDEDFFGFGNHSSSENETNYLQQENRLTFDFIAKIGRNLIAAGASYSNTNILDGRDPAKPTLDSLFVPDQVPGFFGAELLTLQLKFFRNTKDEAGHPTRGEETLVLLELSKEIEGSALGYRKFSIDFRRYFNLFYDRILAIRFRAEVTDNVNGKQIPFFKLAELGGGTGLRGYRPVRFRDRDALLFGAEYRWQVHTWAVAYFFYEQGRVFSNIFDRFSFNGFKYSFGGGLRFTGGDGGLISTLEIAKSKEQLRIGFGLNTELRRF